MTNTNPAYHEAFLRTIIEKLGTDILFECFAGLLVRAGAVNEEDIHIIPKENHKRNYKNDILPATYQSKYKPERFFEKNVRGLVSIYTSRNALLDYLPENVYSDPDNTEEFLDQHGQPRPKKEVEKYRQKQKEELESAERFFKPLEVAYNKVRVRRELDELDKVENFDKILRSFWGFSSSKNASWNRFVQTLHLTPYIIGDEVKTKTLIEFVLGKPISLSFEVEEYCTITESERKALLGDTIVLAYNSILGKSIYDYLDICILSINDLSNEEFSKYFNESTEDRKLINEIIKYYFPLNIEVRLDFTINPEHVGVSPILGYSSKLG